MNRRETIIEANRQIRLLIAGCSEEDRQELKKHIRPVPPMPLHRSSDPVHIGAIVPEVMANIESRMKIARAACA